MADFEEEFVCKNGKRVFIQVDDHTYTASAFDEERRLIGMLEFNEQDDALKLTWAYLDKLGPEYTRQGIGRRCIEIVSERSGLPIIAEDHDGMRKDDGSHLTGDAPAFVNSMRQEGKILHSEQSCPDMERDPSDEDF